jgi:hypothetical protein
VKALFILHCHIDIIYEETVTLRATEDKREGRITWKMGYRKKVNEMEQRRAAESYEPPAPPQEPQNNGLSDDSFSVDSISARISFNSRRTYIACAKESFRI